MLKTYFDVFAVTEEQLTEKALGRLRMASFMSFFLFPSVTILQNSQVSGVMFSILAVLTALAVLGFAYMAMSRIGNRLWVPNKYLDEGEIHRKQVAGYQTYTCIILSVFAAAVAVVISMKFIDLSPPKVSLERVLYYAIGNLITCAVSLQTFFVTRLMQPLDVDDVNGEEVKSKTDKWYKYVACAFVILFLILPLMFGGFGEFVVEGVKNGGS